MTGLKKLSKKKREERDRKDRELQAELNRVFKDMASKQQDLDPEISKVLNKRFWDLL